MATYHIDSFDLIASGFGVRSVTGIEDIPGRKGETSQSWDDSDGVEAFTDAEDIILKEKEFIMELYLIAATTEDAQASLTALEQALFAPGFRSVTIDYVGSALNCYCKKAINAERISKAEGGLIAYTVRVEFVISETS